MDSVYFNWQSHILTNAREGNEVSLRELLDIIPTDIPKDASEFDEELRNLIIDLYSDKSLPTESKLCEDRNLGKKLVGFSRENDKRNTLEHLEKLGGHLNDLNPFEEKKNETSSPSVSAHQVGDLVATQMTAVEETDEQSDFLSTLKEENKNAQMRINSEAFLTVDLLISESTFQDKPLEVEVRSDSDIGNMSTAGDTEKQPKLVSEHAKSQYFKEEIGNSTTNHKNDIMAFQKAGDCTDTAEDKSIPKSNSATNNKAPHSYEGRFVPRLETVGDQNKSDRQINSSGNSSPEMFQNNLDELGDGETARFLTSFSGWLSKISSDPPRDLLGSVTLLDKVPKETYLDIHNQGVTIAETTDTFSMADKPSTLDDNEQLLKSHPLSVITEEPDVPNKQNKVLEQDVENFQASQSSSDLIPEKRDSGLGSMSLFSQSEDSDGEQAVNAYYLEEDTDSQISIELALDSGRFQTSSQELLIGKGNESSSKTNCNAESLLIQLNQKLDGFKSSSTEHQKPLSLTGSDDINAQVESLSSEYAVLLREKMSLKKAIWDLEDSLSAEKKLAEIKDEEKFDAESQKEQIEAVVEELEDKLKMFEKESLKKDEKLRETIRKLEEINESYNELEKKAASKEHELKSKNEDMERLKLELRNCIAASQAANENKEKSESQLLVISDAFQKLKQSKDWLEFQLKTLSDSRAKMQLEFEEAKVERNDKSMALNELKSENKWLSTKLAELNFASANEKSEILKSMEKVENEIREHHLLYSKLENENNALENLLKERENIIEKDELKIKELIDLVSSAETRAENLTAEISSKENMFEKISDDLRTATVKLEEYDKMVGQIEEEKVVNVQRCSKLDEEILRLQGKVDAQDHEMSLLVAEKQDLERKLEAANEEKAEFENAAVALKNDMQKINLIFHVMKKDLASKSSLLQTIDAKKVELIKEMKDLQEYMVEQGQVQNQLRENLKEKMEMVRELSTEKEELSKEVEQLKEWQSQLQSKLDTAIGEKETFIQESIDSKKKWLEQQEEFAREITGLKTKQESLFVENKEKENLLVELKEKQHIMEGDYDRERKENQIEIAGLRAKENKLLNRLKEKQQEWSRKEENYESSILSLVEKLKQESITRQSLTTTCAEQKDLIKQKDDQRRLIIAKIQDVIHQFSSLKVEKESVRKDLKDLKDSSGKFFSFMTNAISRLNGQLKDVSESNESLTVVAASLREELIDSKKRYSFQKRQLENEKERGKQLERELESKGEELKTAKKQMIVLRKDKDVVALKFSQFKKKTEAKFLRYEKEKAELAETSQRLKEENYKLLMQLQQRDIDFEKLTAQRQEEENKISKLEKSFEDVSVSEKNAQAEKSKVMSAYDELQGMVFSLENQLGIEKSHSRVLSDQVNNMKWQCKQAAAEACSRKEELDTLRSHHENELRNVNSLLNVAKTELGCHRTEIFEIRKDKQKCNGQLIEVRERLRRQGTDFEKLQDEILKRNEELRRLKEDMKGCKSAAVREMIEFILRKAVIQIPNREIMEDNEPRPCAALVTLRKCMSGLRDEMDTLHSDMSTQLEYIEGSRTKLTTFQENLGGLHSACKSLHHRTSLLGKNDNNDVKLKSN